MLRFLPVALLFVSLNSFAQAIEYKTLADVKKADFYRLTCSDTSKPMHIHTFLTVEKDVITKLQLIWATPALSLNVIEYSQKDLQGLKVTEGADQIQYAGDRPGAYWAESYLLTLKEGVASFEYDDGDGTMIRRELNCGAVNYIFSPREW